MLTGIRGGGAKSLHIGLFSDPLLKPTFFDIGKPSILTLRYLEVQDT